MRILLVTPASPAVGERWMPLGLCYIASVLERDGHEVKIVDRYLQALRSNLESANQFLVHETRAFQPDIIGFSTYSPYIHDTAEAVRIVRSQTKARILLGGHHATVFPKLTLERIPESDAVIAGEAEISFSQYAAEVRNEIIPGLYWRRNGVPISGTTEKPVDLNRLPLPAYHLLDMGYYTGKNAHTIRPYYLSAGSILSSRGCRNRCTFCTESLTFPGKPRMHSPDVVFENIDVLRVKYNCKGITFLDNDFLGDRQWAEDILRGIIKRQWNRSTIYCVQARADNIDNDIVNLMKEAGFLKVEIGFETSRQASLDNMKKNLVTGTNENAVMICRKQGISVQANLMFGMEDETIGDLDTTLNWIKKMKVQNVKWGKIMLYPGSLLYSQKGKSFFETNEWTKENVERFFCTDLISSIPQKDLLRWIDRRLKPFLRVSCHQGFVAQNKPVDITKRYFDATIWRIKRKHEKRKKSLP